MIDVMRSVQGIRKGAPDVEIFVDVDTLAQATTGRRRFWLISLQATFCISSGLPPPTDRSGLAVSGVWDCGKRALPSSIRFRLRVPRWCRRLRS
jgi:hypothetical protein